MTDKQLAAPAYHFDEDGAILTIELAGGALLRLGGNENRVDRTIEDGREVFVVRLDGGEF